MRISTVREVRDKATGLLRFSQFVLNDLGSRLGKRLPPREMSGGCAGRSSRAPRTSSKNLQNDVDFGKLVRRPNETPKGRL